MIAITVIPDVRSKAGEASGAARSDVAETTWDGSTYSAQSRNGASCKLARVLVAAGCPDQPWETRTPQGQRCLFGTSLHGLARATLSDNRFVRWQPRPHLDEPDAANAAWRAHRGLQCRLTNLDHTD